MFRGVLHVGIVVARDIVVGQVGRALRADRIHRAPPPNGLSF